MKFWNGETVKADIKPKKLTIKGEHLAIECGLIGNKSRVTLDGHELNGVLSIECRVAAGEVVVAKMVIYPKTFGPAEIIEEDAD